MIVFEGMLILELEGRKIWFLRNMFKKKQHSLRRNPDVQKNKW